MALASQSHLAMNGPDSVLYLKSQQTPSPGLGSLLRLPTCLSGNNLPNPIGILLALTGPKSPFAEMLQGHQCSASC